MSYCDIRLTKLWKCPQLVTLFCQIIGVKSQSNVIAICQIMTRIWHIMTGICQTQFNKNHPTPFSGNCTGTS